MRSMLFALASFALMAAGPAWGHDAMHFYELGLKSSLANRRIQYFSKALELNPRLATAYEKRGLHYYFQGKYGKMIQDYQKVIDLTPQKPNAYGMVGLGHMRQGNLDTAIDCFSRAIELDPKQARAYAHRAEAHRLKGLAHQAVQDASKAIELDSSQQITGRAYTTRAKAYRELGQSKLADADFDKALRLDPGYYVYNLFSVTEFLAYLASSSEYSDVRRVGWLGLALVIGLLFVVIFKLALPPPDKDHHG